MAEISGKVVEHLGVLEEGSKGWKVELNKVSWFDKDPGYDIRAWSEDHDKCGKGLGLSETALVNLRDVLNKLFPVEDDQSNN